MNKKVPHNISYCISHDREEKFLHLNAQYNQHSWLGRIITRASHFSPLSHIMNVLHHSQVYHLLHHAKKINDGIPAEIKCEESAKQEKEKILIRNNAVRTIQRAYRKHLFLKTLFLTKNKTEIEKLIDDYTVTAHIIEQSHYWQVPLLHSPCQPLQRNTIATAKLASFLSSKKRSEQRQLSALLRHNSVKNITFEQFQNTLNRTVSHALAAIMSLPKQNRSYVIISDSTEKSARWSINHALKIIGRHYPKDIIMKEAAKDFFSENTDIQHILMIDDGCYSGEQISSSIKEIKPFLREGVEIHVAIPFMTSYGYTRIQQESSKRNPIRIAYHHSIFSIAELFSYYHGLRTKNRISINLRDDLGRQITHDRLKYLTLTYFEHKIPDYISSMSWILSEITPHTIPPYKIDYELQIQNLEQDMDRIQRIECTLTSGNEIRKNGISFIKAQKGDFIYGFSFLPHRMAVVRRKTLDFAIEQRSTIKLLQGDILEFNGVQHGIYNNGILCDIREPLRLCS